MPARKGRRRKGEPPAYLLHKSTGRAYVFLHGKEVYLGKYGSAESRRRYREIVKAWEQETDASQPTYHAKAGCTIADLVAAHASFARQHYRTPDGELTSEYRGFVRSLKPLLGDEYVSMLADEFRPAHLKAIRESWVKAGHARNTVNQSTARIRRLFKWGAGEELIRYETAAALTMVKGLAEGRTPAVDYEPVQPVPLRDLAGVLRECSPQLAAMIRVQYYCGARPGEVCRMTAEEIDQSGIVHAKSRKIQLPGGVWVFQPSRFKQRHTGKIVAYILGRRAQAAMRDHIGMGGVVFPSPRRRGEPWSESGYYHAIADACLAAGVSHWSPGQLRHNYLSRIDSLAGIQLASYAVGHASIDTTAIYVERNLRAVAEAVAIFG